MAGNGRPSAQLPSPQQQQKPIANDHIPLTFLLGSRAKHYATPKQASHGHNPTNLASGSASTTKISSASSRNSPLPVHQQRRRDNVELFAPERHPREREAEARRVLAQALSKNPPSNPDSSKKYPNSSSPRSSTASITTLSPMGVLRENKDQVLHQVLELRQLENEPSEEEDCEPQHRRRTADLQTAIDAGDGDEDARATSFHGYQRVDQQASFLDVSGNASRIPVLSNLKAKEMHQNLLKKQSRARAKRVDELHAFLQGQQQYTKLQLASLASNPTSHKQVARVDLGIDGIDGDKDGNRPEVHIGGSAVTTANVLVGMKEQLKQEQALLHERVQENKLVAQLTRQQKLAFHQQQKRTLGRVKGVKRPSFLATLQLDNNSTSYGEGGTTANRNAARACLLGGESFGREQNELSLRKVNEEESEHEHECESERKLQRDTFLHSEGGLHFGGGFRSKPSNKNKKIPAVTQRTSHSIGDDATVEAMSHELQELLECGAVGVKQKR